MTKPTHYGLKAKRSPEEQREHMAEYMRHRRASRVRAVGGQTPIIGSDYDVARRHELRDGSGIKMWPERVRESATPMTDGDREITAAAKRRAAGVVPEPYRPPSRQPQRKPGPSHRTPQTGLRKFEQRSPAS
jgi:hypothetical protein